jgi:hypothetical protein
MWNYVELIWTYYITSKYISRISSRNMKKKEESDIDPKQTSYSYLAAILLSTRRIFPKQEMRVD